MCFGAHAADVESTVGTPALRRVANTGHGVAALASLDGRLFVCRRDIRAVFVYDAASFQLLDQLCDAGFSTQLRGLAACSVTGRLYVSDYANGLVHRIRLSSSSATTTTQPTEVRGSQQLHHKKSLKSWKAETPTGLSTSSRTGRVLVACWECRKIVEFTRHGAVVREIPDANHVSFALELSAAGLLLVARCGPVDAHDVCTKDGDGRVVRIICCGEDGGDDATAMNNPSCLAVTEQGYVLVADRCNDRVLVGRTLQDGVRTCTLPLGAVDGPAALCYDETNGRLWVGEADAWHRVLMYTNVNGFDALFRSA